MNLSGGVIGEGTRQESPGLIAYISAQDGITPQQAAGYQNSAMRFVLKASPPNVFIGGPVPNQPGFPLKACGNDGLRIGNLLNAASCGESTHRD